jgi:hypothetical protein
MLIFCFVGTPTVSSGRGLESNPLMSVQTELQEPLGVL